MWQAIGGFAVGLGAVYIAPRIISGISSAAGPLADEALKMSQATCAAVVDGLSAVGKAANEQVAGLFSAITGESKEEAEKKVEKAEHFLEEAGKDIAQEEAVNFIEALVVAAI